jgi:predicted  nucleic acid-binding Zn ribbon protein
MPCDRYWKLKPELLTPVNEICGCDPQHPIVLCNVLTRNPIRCLNCNQELPPERWQPTAEMVEHIASWRRFHSCFYGLWLDSGEFEEWAHQQLSDPQSPVNQRSYELCQMLSELRLCYYWYFQDPEADPIESLRGCPRCGGHWTRRCDRLVCEDCQILVRLSLDLG